MKCPSCQADLPAKFALSSSLVQFECPACGVPLEPTPDSLELITSRSFSIGFLLGLPMGALVALLALRTSSWIFGLIGAVLTLAGVTVSCYVYSKNNIIFKEAKHESG